MAPDSAEATADYKLSSLPQNAARRVGGEEVGRVGGESKRIGGEGRRFETGGGLSGRVDVEAHRDGVKYSVHPRRSETN